MRVKQSVEHVRSISIRLDRRVPTILGYRVFPVTLLVVIYFIVVLGALLGADHGYHATSLSETLIYVSGDHVVTGGEHVPIGYEGSGLLYHIVGVVLYLSFHLAFAAATVMASVTYMTAGFVPPAFWGYLFNVAPFVVLPFIGWAGLKDLQSIHRRMKKRGL